ncbi:Metabotropic glutamate receptor 2 [Eufriesea mexicana]|nr:Metabotropic glutamate receptor 2 [Eufriesea mexicana]
MKLLLLALLGCMCSADREPSDGYRFRQDRFDEDDYTDHGYIDRDRLTNLVDVFDPGRSIIQAKDNGHDDRIRSRAYPFRFENPETHHPIRHGRRQFRSMNPNAHVPVTWPVKKEAVVEGDLVLGGLMMVHEREDTVTCGPVMSQGGVQALEAMLYTLDKLNEGEGIVPGVKIGAHILDDCDKDTYGLEMAVDFIKAQDLVRRLVLANKTVRKERFIASWLSAFALTLHAVQTIREVGDNEILKNTREYEAKFMTLGHLWMALRNCTTDDNSVLPVSCAGRNISSRSLDIQWKQLEPGKGSTEMTKLVRQPSGTGGSGKRSDHPLNRSSHVVNTSVHGNDSSYQTMSTMVEVIVRKMLEKVVIALNEHLTKKSDDDS